MYGQLIALMSVSFIMHCNQSDMGNNGKINLYSFYTPSHAVLKDDWFLPSIKDNFNVITAFAEQSCPTGVYHDPGFQETVLKKVDIIVDAIKENRGKIIIYADIDIQFFEPIQELIEHALKDNDMVVQRDSPKGLICSGFFACRCNNQSLAVWEHVKELMMNESYDDQNALNRVLKRHERDIRWDYLPVTFFSTGTLAGTGWIPGKTLDIPEGIVLHHANWTKGVANKCALLEYVKTIVEKRKNMQ